MKDNLVFDLGFLNGEDTENYLDKGFDVLAVEANYTLYEKAKERFSEQIKLGKLELLNRALVPMDDTKETIKFYINTARPEVSSTEEWISSQLGMYNVAGYSVNTININSLIKTYGVPYYLKIDIEGADKHVLSDLRAISNFTGSKNLPKYISAELNKNDYLEIIRNLLDMGYREFQLINQIHNKKNTSGEFGDFLDKNKWIGPEETLNRYVKYRDLKIIDNLNLGVGWLDIHAKLL